MRTLVASRAAVVVVTLLTATIVSADPDLESRGCPGAFGIFAEATAEDFKPPQNIFGSSLPYMVPSAVGILIVTQYFKHALLGSPDTPVFSEAFPITVANDTLTTLTSHYIATSKLEGLKRFLEGKGKNGEIGFWRRAGANTALGTALISATWLGAGMDVGPTQVCGALGLCTVVYPTLQALKHQLYERLPLKRDVRELTELAKTYPKEVEQLRDVALAKAEEFEVSPKQAEFLILTALESVMTNQPLESKISESLYEHSETLADLAQRAEDATASLSEFGRDLNELTRSDRKTLRRLVKEQRSLRRQILNELIEIAESAEPGTVAHADAEQMLSFGEDVDPAFALALHKSMRNRLKGFRGRLAFASVVDMSIAIGFFGGVCLEATNYWAKTGEVPPVLQILAGAG